VDFTPSRWASFAGATLLVGATFGLLGVLAGSLFGKIGGLYLMFLLPFIDVGIAQNIMFDAAPAVWGSYMPSYGAVRLLVDGAFTTTFDEGRGLMLAAAWLVGIGAAATLVFRRLSEPQRA
jgi:hypothetical protein